MKVLPPSCDFCTLGSNELAGRFTQVSGNGDLGVLIVGEASGETEAASGMPFERGAAAGSILEKVIKRKRWTREQFWITNVIRCRPPRNWLEGAPWERAAIEHCQPNLKSVIDQLRPRAIIALGGVACRELTGLSGGKRTISYLRGYVLPGIYGVPVVPSYHPAFIARGMGKVMGLLMRDLTLAVEVAAGRIKPCYNMREVVNYEVGLEALKRLYDRALADPTLLITYDLETDKSAGQDEDEVLEYTRSMAEGLEGDREKVPGDNGDDDAGSGEMERSEVDGPGSALDVQTARIKTIQFSIEPRTGVSVPWNPGYEWLVRKILALPNPKAGHNTEMFDDRILKREGVVIAGERWDTLWMFHMWQPDLPAHLQGVVSIFGMEAPWKHLAGEDLEWYGAADVDAVQRIMALLPQELKRDGLWEAYLRYVRGFRPVLDAMERRGIPINAQRLRELRDWINAEITQLQEQINGLVPVEVRNYEKEEPYASIMYVPKEVRDWLKENHPDVAGAAKSKQNGLIKQLDLRDGHVTVALANAGLEVRGNVEGDHRIYKTAREPFNPGSSQQILNYIKARGYPVPKRFKDGKDTTGDKELEKLFNKTKDPVIKLTRSVRATAKLGNAYCGKVGADGVESGGWVPTSDGRLHATFTGGSAVWQLTAYNPNVLTTPKRRKELAKKFGACIEAPPGYRLVQFDFKSFHALMTGREARDERYMRLARIDAHSFVAGHMVKYPGIDRCLDLSDEDLTALLLEIKTKHKDVRDNQAKPAVHGTNFGQGYRRLFFEYRDHFKSEGEAQALLMLLRRLFPRLFAWQEAVLAEADEKGYLQSKWGARRYFHDIYSWRKIDGEWRKNNGKDAEKAKAYFPSNHAHGMMREKLLGMEERGWNERYGLINVPHDAIWMLCPEKYLDECLTNVAQWMEAPVMQLADPVVCPEGFACGVDAAVGHNWAEMEEVR